MSFHTADPNVLANGGWRICASHLADELSECCHGGAHSRGSAATSNTVSVLTAAQFNADAREDRAVGAQSAAVVHQLGTAAVAAGFGAHATAEAANVTATG